MKNFYLVEKQNKENFVDKIRSFRIREKMWWALFRFWKFVKMIAFCFYIPNGIGGPLINYKDYYEGVKT